MSRILVSGLINIETTLRSDGFPIEYIPVRYPFNGVHSSVSGVGYNLSKALTTLGHDVDFFSLIGSDLAGGQVRAALKADDISDLNIISQIEETPQSVIIYDESGRRQINVDLKNIQEQIYPAERFEQAMQQAELLALCNVNFSRPMLKIARDAGKLVATDVHTIGDLHDEYNSDYMAAANILFMSDEHLPMSPEEWAKTLFKTYQNDIVVIGLGVEGALLAVRRDGFVGRFPAVEVRPVVNTIGEGDALFSSFLHSYLRTRDPYVSIHQAILFAGYKIGGISAADGFLTADELDRLVKSRE